ncbi:MAG: metal-dependent hydrolase [Bacillota bacterium]
MDIFTHTMAGLAIGALSGQPAALTNPLCLSCVLGAVAPDIDVTWGYNKLKKRKSLPGWLQHRSITHSLLGMPTLALFIAITIKWFFPETSFWFLFIFALLGTLSHSLLDLTNYHGVKLLWPLSPKSYSLNILPLIDPVVIVLFIITVISRIWQQSLPPVIFLVLFCYIVLRWYFFYHVRNHVSDYYEVAPSSIQLIPPPMSLRKWCFSIAESGEDISGEITFFPRINLLEDHQD